MTSFQNALAALGILLTGGAIADFLAEHQALLTALACLAIFTAISYSMYRNRNH